MNYAIAEYKYVSHLRDAGYVGEVVYPDKDSRQKGEDLMLNRNKIPMHLLYLSDKQLKALFYLFRGRV